MKKLKISISVFAIFALLFTSCSKEETTSPGDDPNLQSVEITFGAALNDLVNRAASVNKDHFDDIPDCSAEPPSYVVLEISYDGQPANTEGPITLDILSDSDGYFTEYSELLKIPVEDEGFTTVTLESFMVYDSNDNLIWIAPIESVEGEFDGYVTNPLPYDFEVRDGTKPYIDVEVLCFDRRMVNEYGYPFFDLVPGELYPLCFFANYCPSVDGRHYVGNYAVDLYYDDGETRVQLYNSADAGSSPNTNDDNNSADPLCLVVPGSPFENPDTDYLFYVITPLDWPGSYGDIDNTPLIEVGLSWNDVNGLLNADGETAEYIHLFIGCDTPIDECPGVPTPSDPDGDCVPDDQCPDEPGTVDNFGCPDDECPGTDPDGDGLFGDCDDCPNEAGTADNFGCPLDDCTTDTDNDGVVDCDDLCPDTQGPEDNDGCPEDNGGDTCETAFMFGDTQINDISNANRWGWAENFDTTIDGNSKTFNFWAGAGQNDTSKGELVGTVTITVDGDEVNFDIDLESGVSLDDLHVYLSEDNPGNTAKSPGQYNRNDEVSSSDLDFTLERTSDDTSFWIIVHGVACY
ncbi:hypothetical protein [Christiangramia sediminis]|uniref:Uncharacterized protein n=1 Tax=Christiangramia sediminis TaxID=2881336 RepID=A0A9X1LHW3_9FLAO|nr:hypothetical protein [Christiangramia sediminis]MCB7480655.1 hypothetical protein [Christiangramia sediminis]